MSFLRRFQEMKIDRFHRFAGVLALVIGAGAAHEAPAGVIVTENQSGLAWPGVDPAIDTASGQAPSVFNHGVNIPAAGSASQTFLVEETFTLDRIDVAYSTSATSGTVELRLQEAVVSNNGSNFVYAEGTNLFATADLSFTYSIDTDGVKVLTLDFTGADEIVLEANKTYAIEFVDPDAGSVGFALRRRGSSTYGAGVLFTGRSSVNGLATRDAGLQVFAVIPEPASLALMSCGGMLMLARRRPV